MEIFSLELGRAGVDIFLMHSGHSQTLQMFWCTTWSSDINGNVKILQTIWFQSSEIGSIHLGSVSLRKAKILYSRSNLEWKRILKHTTVCLRKHINFWKFTGEKPNHFASGIKCSGQVNTWRKLIMSYIMSVRALCFKHAAYYLQ